MNSVMVKEGISEDREHSVETQSPSPPGTHALVIYSLILDRPASRAHRNEGAVLSR